MALRYGIFFIQSLSFSETGDKLFDSTMLVSMGVFTLKASSSLNQATMELMNANYERVIM